MKPRAIFLDDGGVIGDNSKRGPQWRKLVGDFFAPRLGGTAAAWGEANAEVIKYMLPELTKAPKGSYVEFWNAYQCRWLRDMAELVGVEAPADDDECAALANESNVYITNRVDAGLPGAADAVRKLKRMGLDLYTASGGLSWQLDGYFKSLGIRDQFIELYGPDLVDRAKYGPTDGTVFYRRVFEHARVDAATALVIDDSPDALASAAQVGAATCLVSGYPSIDEVADLVIGSLAELPSLLDGEIKGAGDS